MCSRVLCLTGGCARANGVCSSFHFVYSFDLVCVLFFDSFVTGLAVSPCLFQE